MARSRPAGEPGGTRQPGAGPGAGPGEWPLARSSSRLGVCGSPVPAGPDDQTERHRVARARRAGLMTGAPARQSDRPGRRPGPASAAGAGAAAASAAGPVPRGLPRARMALPRQTGRPPVPAELMAPRSRWSRVGWLFAAIWLVYLAQPVGKLWSRPEPGPPVPGTGRPDRFRGRVHRDVRRRPVPAGLPEPADIPPDRRGRAGRREPCWSGWRTRRSARQPAAC